MLQHIYFRVYKTKIFDLNIFYYGRCNFSHFVKNFEILVINILIINKATLVKVFLKKGDIFFYL